MDASRRRRLSDGEDDEDDVRASEEEEMDSDGSEDDDEEEDEDESKIWKSATKTENAGKTKKTKAKKEEASTAGVGDKSVELAERYLAYDPVSAITWTVGQPTPHSTSPMSLNPSPRRRND